MGDWPNSLPFFAAGAGLHSASLGAGAQEYLVIAGSNWATTGNTGSLVITYQPVIVATQMTAYQIGWVNGATVSGSIDCGIYDYEGNLLINTGSTAQSGISAIQTVDITDTLLQPGMIFLAFQMDNATGLVNIANAGTSQIFRTCGMQQQTTGALGLPSPATFTTYANGSAIPFIGVGVESATF